MASISKKQGESVDKWSFKEYIITIPHGVYERDIKMWVIYGLASAAFAAFATILDKTAVNALDPNYATAFRYSTVAVMSWVIVFGNNTPSQVNHLNAQGWNLQLLAGVLTALSCLAYYKALSLADVSKVLPINRMSLIITILLANILLREIITAKTLLGGALIMLGTFFLVV